MTTDKEHYQAHSTNEHSLDELAKGLANGSLSRRDALKWAGAALVGGLLSAIPGVALAKPPPHGTPPGQGGTPPGQGGTPPGQGTTTTTPAPTTTSSTTTTPPPVTCADFPENPCAGLCCDTPEGPTCVGPTCESTLCVVGEHCCEATCTPRQAARCVPNDVSCLG